MLGRVKRVWRVNRCTGSGQMRLRLACNSSTVATKAAATTTRNEVTGKKKVVILGCGWGGFRLAQDIDKSLFDVVVVSPRNHFLFTPLLPSTAVGTLEFRCIQEPIRTIPGVEYIQASTTQINFTEKNIECVEIYKKVHFLETFDYLFIAVGSKTNTFGVPGVTGNDHVFFLKQLEHARAIRNRLIECFERASAPTVGAEERQRLLTFVVVGGGPTNIEFASELHDFLHDDVSRWYPDLKQDVKVIVIEASQNILGTFKSSLVDYVEKLFKSRKIEVHTKTAIKEVNKNVAILGDGSELPFGVMVWSTGIKQVSLIERTAADVASSHQHRLLVDGHLRVLERPVMGASPSPTASEPVAGGSVFAIGDCACNVDRPLPSLAQVWVHCFVLVNYLPYFQHFRSSK
jgi:NADH dehydrogenase FAD-containing subunit